MRAARAPLILASAALAVAAALSVGGLPGTAASPNVTAPSVTDPQDAPGGLDVQQVTWSGDASTASVDITDYTAFADSDARFYAYLDTTGDGVADYWVVAEYHPATGSIEAGVAPVGTAHLRRANVTRSGPASLSVAFPRAWIAGATSFDWYLTSVAAGPPGAAPITDVVPDTPTVTAPVPTRVGGSDRVATSVAASFFADGEADSAVLARSDSFADAVAGAPLAVAKHGPLLLTAGATLDPRTASELARVLPAGRTVYLLGGTDALSGAVEAAVAAAGYRTVRYGGADRFETSVTVLQQGLGSVSSVLLATGLDFADAVSAGAAAGARGTGVLLTDGATLPPVVSAWLSADPGAVQYAIGHPAAAADPSATPIAGVDRYDTSAQVATFFFPAPESVGVASGLDFPDALAGGATTAEGHGPVLLTDPANLPAPCSAYISSHLGGAAVVPPGVVFGGPAAVSDAVLAQVRAALGA